jgi:hypothetical protein
MKLRTWLPLGALLVGGAFGLGGCAQAARKSGDGDFSRFPVPPLMPTAPSYSLPLPVFGRRHVDSKWLFGDEFFPPGATRIFPSPPVKPKLNETPQIKYPSMEVLPSPDGALTIFSDSGESKNVMVHWLMVYRKGDAQPASLFHTRNTYEVIWSADSVRAAITEFIGDNRSEVTIGDMRDYSRGEPLDVRPAVAAYFTVDHLAAPRFVRAQAFGDGALLLVRCVGQLAESPFDQFGFEVFVDLTRLDDPAAMTFVRGYVLPGERLEK